MKVYFLAAGKGERMVPYSDIMEKCLLPIGGKPIIRITIENILKSGIARPEDICISMLPKYEDQFIHEFRDIPLNIRTIDESPNTATHYQIISNRDRIGDDEDVMMHYADNLSALDYKKFITEYYRAVLSANAGIKCAIAGTILIKHDYSAIRYKGKLEQYLNLTELVTGKDAADRFFDVVTEFVEKPYLGDRGWMGVAIFKNGAMMDTIKGISKESVDFGFDVLPAMAAKGQVILHKHEGEWFDVGNVTSYMKLRKRIATGEKIV